MATTTKKAIQEENELRATKLERTGKTLSVPENMKLQAAIDFLSRKLEEEEELVDVFEEIDAFPFDACHALVLVMQEKFGYSGTHIEEDARSAMASTGVVFIPVEVERGKTVQVPWGKFTVPGIEGKFHCGMDVKDDNRVVFKLSGEVKGKHRAEAVELADAVRAKLKVASIYKGKAIKVSFRDRNGEQVFFDWKRKPEFMNLTGPEEPIFTADTEEQINVSILNPIRHSDKLRQHGISLRRSVLLEGPFGTGKTLAALQTARECTAAGWTFLYVSDCRDLSEAMRLGEQYAPCVVFAEDVDKVMSGSRDSQMDQLSYALDGVDTKNKDVMTVLTTNKVEDIQQLMLRPGRIDAVVSVQPPDADTVWRLVKLYAAGCLRGEKVDFVDAIQPMSGQNAAFIAEVVKKAKLRAITRSDDCELTIEPEDIRIAVQLMINHVRLMNCAAKPDVTEIPINRLYGKIDG